MAIAHFEFKVETPGLFTTDNNNDTNILNHPELLSILATTPDVLTYTPSTASTAPTALQHMAYTNPVVLVHSPSQTVKVFHVNEEKFNKCISQHFAHQGAAVALILSSLLPVDVQATQACATAFDIHRYVATKYRMSDLATRLSRQEELLSLEFKSLREFLTTLDDAVQKYRAAGGHTGDWLLVNMLGKIPPKYTRLMEINDMKDIDDLTSVLRQLVQSELHADEDSEPNNNNFLNQVQHHHDQSMRCHCGGWGHNPSRCESPKGLCWFCGSAKHQRKDCPNVKSNNNNNINNTDSSSSSNNKNNNHRYKNNQSKKKHWRTEKKKVLETNALKHEPDVTSEEEEDDALQSVNQNVYRMFNMQQVTHEHEVSELQGEATDIEQFLPPTTLPMETVTDADTVYVNTVSTARKLSKCYCRFGDSCLRILMDSGATGSSVNSSDILYEVFPLQKPITLVSAFADKFLVNTEGSGNFMLANNKRLTLKNIVVAPKVKHNIISIRHLVLEDYTVVVSKRDDMVIRDRNNVTVATAPWCVSGGGYFLHCTNEFTRKQCVNSVQHDAHLSSDLIHYRFGHINLKYLKRLQLLNAKQVDKLDCIACAETKLVRKPAGGVLDLTKTSVYVATKPFEKICIDTGGFDNVTGYGGVTCYVIGVCFYSRYQFVFSCKTKDEAGPKVVQYLKLLKNTQNLDTKAIFSDRGSELKVLFDYANVNGMLIETSLSHSHWQNGRAERAIRTVKESSRAMLASACMHDNSLAKLWFYSIQHAATVWNQIPRKNTDKCPSELVFGKRIALSKFVIFGSPGMAKAEWKVSNDKPNRSVRYLGIEPGGGFKLWDVETRRVIVARDCRFYEHILMQAHAEYLKRTIQSPDDIVPRRNFDPNSLTQVFDDMLVQTPEFGQTSDEVQRSVVNSSESVAPPAHTDVPPVTDTFADIFTDTFADTVPVVSEANIVAPPPPTATPTIDTFSSTPVRARRGVNHEISTANIIRGSRHRHAPVRYLFTLLQVATLLPPKRFREIAARADCAEWLKEYLAEVNKLATQGEMTVVRRPHNKRVIKIRELFSVKYDNILGKWICKVRIVARGDLEESEEFVYAPVANMVALRIFVILSLEFGVDFRQLDIASAFLYGRVSEPIFIELPEGHPEKDGGAFVWQTHCAIYGLAEAPRIWHATIDDFLKKFGLCSLVTENCLYVKKIDSKIVLVVLLYVDDILYCGTDIQVREFESAISARFKLKSTTSASSYLGIDITQRHDVGVVVLSQQQYILQAVKKFNLTDAKPVKTPIVGKPEETAPLLEDKRLYQALVGVLLYLNLTTRPDISYAVHYLTRYTAKPSSFHLSMAKRVLTYLRDTADHGLHYRRSENRDIVCFVDASYADGDNRRSTYGYVISLGNNILSFRTKQQASVATSTTEAEFTAVANAVRELLYLKNLSSEVDLTTDMLPEVYVDNQATIKILGNNGSSSKIKHIDVALQFLKERRDIKFRYVVSEDNIADVFTKPLAFNKFDKFRNVLVQENGYKK